MGRFLFVVPPLTGHVNPLQSIAVLLRRQGHDVVWVGHEAAIGHLLPPESNLIGLETRLFLKDPKGHKQGLASVFFLYREFALPMGRDSLAEVEAAIDSFRPDVVVTDQLMFSGWLAARRKGVPYVTTVTTSASIMKVWDVSDRWLVQTLAEVQREFDLEPMERPDLSPIANLVFSTQVFCGSLPRFEAPYLFVGPSTNLRSERIDFPWDRLREEVPAILVSLGTINRDRDPRFYDIVAEATADMGVQVVMVAPEDWVSRAPEHVIAAPRVPQLALLPFMSAVLCHGGHNTVCESLAHDLPLVVTPICDDQPLVARLVLESGAGLRLRFGRLTADAVREAVGRVLEEPSFQAAARRIGQSFRRSGGAAMATTALTEVAAGLPPSKLARPQRPPRDETRLACSG
ncbi:Glycosyltransferase family 1 protein [Sulfidibacter corallicola]|uniref:Glycosyltransferase family 1 protein n=1 Tax=Sulfidibacter corallicola TaxID=2818388 RepID=A0A8A4U164_SULCO|nr:glycosyltransferase [Sulfidibacter corallicola]QTD52485.1 glycosyltransferase family 1 protein [Sulfidibacter corallicola]